MDNRAEGVYCHWESDHRVFVIERVGGDGSISTFVCAEDETSVIREALKILP